MSATHISITGTLHTLLCTVFCGLLMASPAFAQDIESAEPDPDDPSRETDISEDNYRRYMELKDPRLERPAFPATVFKPPSSLEKMAQLPESSQKHLRNQLRGIILQSGPWTPAEEDREYRLIPSPEAQQDATLLRAEAEAWNELVGEYHEREAESLASANGQRSRQGSAATGTEARDPSAQERAHSAGDPTAGATQQPALAGVAGSGNTGESDSGESGTGQDSPNDGQQGQGQSGQSGQAASSSSSDGSPSRQAQSDGAQDPDLGPPDAVSTEGVAQSASEVLKNRGLAQDVPAETLPKYTDESADAGHDGRWGSEYLSMLPALKTPDSAGGQTEPARATPNTPEDSGGAASTAYPSQPGTLTIEQLREVQGVTATQPANANENPDGASNWDFENDAQGNFRTLEQPLLESLAPDAEPEPEPETPPPQ